MPTDPSEEQLITRAVAGNRSALEELLLDHSARLARFLAPKIPTSMQGVLGVDDVLQQTFVVAFRDVVQLRQTTPQSFSSWLKTVAEHQLQDALKALRRKKRGGDFRRDHEPAARRCDSVVALADMLLDPSHTPGRSVARREAARAIQVGVAGLPADQQEAIRRHLLDGDTLEETAAAMDRTPGAVRALIHRGKQRLREVMGRASLWFSSRK